MATRTKKSVIDRPVSDIPVLAHIQRLVAEEHRLYAEESLSAADSDRLKKVEVELDQCWDLLRQRRAVGETGIDSANAAVRPPEIVEKYSG